MQTMTENRLDLKMFPENLINPKSKWYTLEKLIPWREIEELLAPLFKESGRNAIPVRHIIGALIVQTSKNLSDRETIEVIMETPMIQYFLGFDTFTHDVIFDDSNLSKYRKRIGQDVSKDMIETLLKHHKVTKVKPKTHYGAMSIDATAVPVNITYPTDVKLLEETRVQTEKLIDAGYEASDEEKKPRTYRKVARKDFLKAAKSKRLSNSKRRAALRAQLQYIRRNLKTIKTRIENGTYQYDDAQLQTLETCQTIYNQQKTM